MESDEQFLAMLAEVLYKERVEAIIVGNMASILHNAPVTTQDIDILVRGTKIVRARLNKVARALGGIGPLDISDLTSVQKIVGAAVPVDILYDQISGGLKFESVRARSTRMKFGKYSIAVASLRDVIKSKTAVNRPKDRAVLPVLHDTLRVTEALDAGSKQGRYGKK